MKNPLVPIAGNSVSSDTSRKPGAVSLESEPRRNQLERSPCSSGRKETTGSSSDQELTVPSIATSDEPSP